MSHDALQPRQFGNYVTRPYGARGVEAVHARSGRRVGAMNWFDQPISDLAVGKQNAAGQTVEAGKPTIFKVVVSKPQRRKGIASAMLDHARDLAPGLQHSHALSEDGTAWAKAKP